MIGFIFIFLGICFIVISTMGMIRFQDFYTRLQAVSMTDSAGALLLLIGFILQNKFSISTIKMILLIFIIWMINSTNSYILAHTYYRVNMKKSKS
ncbi:MAG: monovalent cation/H(+) antiporter subunit G [Wolbachia endosymbiont of Menacanthus eurysternus]|nr:MAG: monovalent cation/H(+) antiporter subunit G [Wolbachia endosymbiont of Menacanthus eurysternus]